MAKVLLNGKLASETVTEVFNFSSRLASGETISSATVTATVFSGTDSSPSAIVSGAAAISGAQVSQKIVGGVLGVTYSLACTAVTSTGQTLMLVGLYPILPDAL